MPPDRMIGWQIVLSQFVCLPVCVSVHRLACLYLLIYTMKIQCLYLVHIFLWSGTFRWHQHWLSEDRWDTEKIETKIPFFWKTKLNTIYMQIFHYCITHPTKQKWFTRNVASCGLCQLQRSSLSSNKVTHVSKWGHKQGSL